MTNYNQNAYMHEQSTKEFGVLVCIVAEQEVPKLGTPFGHFSLWSEKYFVFGMV